MKRTGHGILLLAALACVICWAGIALGASGAAPALPVGERQALAIATPGERQVYAITNDTETAAFYNITIKNVDIPNEDYYGSFLAKILDDNDEELSGIALHTEHTGLLSQRLLPGETCYLAVFMNDRNRQDAQATGSYQVTVEAVPDEAGETIYDAAPIPLGERQALKISGQRDVDVFEVTNHTETAAFYNITIKNVNIPNEDYYGSFRANILDTNDEVLSDIALHTEQSGRLSQRLLPGETCYLELYMNDRNDSDALAMGDYQVTVEEAPDEAGESIRDAAPIALGEKLTLRITGHGDIDVFAVTNETNGDAFYNVTVKNVDIPNEDYYASFVARFLDEDNEALSDIALRTEESGQLSRRLAPGETCYLQFFMKDNDDKNATGEYTVTVRQAADDAAGTIAGAQPIALEEKLSLHITGHGDVDVFAVTNETDGDAFYNVTVKNVDIPNEDYYASFVARFLDEEGEALSDIALKTEESGQLSRRLSPGETCYLQFFMKDNDDKNATGEYTVTVRQVADDIGDTPETALPLALGESAGGTLDGAGDVDCIRITASDVDALLTVEVVNEDIEAGSGDSALLAVIRDEDGNEAASLSMKDGARMGFHAGAGKAYTLHLFMGAGAADKTGGYTVRACMDPVHFPSGGWETTLEPTCTEAGTRVQKCGLCGEYAITGTLAALDHDYGEWTEMMGVRTRACTRCDRVETYSLEGSPDEVPEEEKPGGLFGIMSGG